VQEYDSKVEKHLILQSKSLMRGTELEMKWKEEIQSAGMRTVYLGPAKELEEGQRKKKK
jgi:hypothetical protein